MNITIIIAIISLLVSAVTLYLAQLRPSKLISKSGPFIKVYYADYESGGSVGLYLPVSIINESARTGTILNAAITLGRKDSPEQSYFMQWREFQKLSIEKNAWVYEEMAHALAIPGTSAINKIIWFMWDAKSQPKLILREGTYIINFYFWDKKDKPPNCETHQFYVDDSIYTQLESYRVAKKPTVFDIRLDMEIEQNRLLTEHELRKLLG